jgi:2-(1,2-epoxy-1,2-dihydrophenyl)acetyl-CoA isomerase
VKRAQESIVEYTKIKLSVEDEVAVITLADPATMNAAGADTANELLDAFRRLATGSLKARAIVLTGEGRGFCSGANLQAGGTPLLDGDGKADAGRSLEIYYNPLVTAMRDSDILKWSRKTGQGFKVGSPLMKDGSDDWQTQALLG